MDSEFGGRRFHKIGERVLGLGSRGRVKGLGFRN